jgi:hypothetical protein
MTTIVKKSTQNRRALLGQTGKQFVKMSGDAMRSIVEKNAFDPTLAFWVHWYNQAPALDFDATALTLKQCQDLIELVKLQTKKDLEYILKYLDEIRLDQEYWRTVAEKLSQGLAPPKAEYFFWDPPVGIPDFSQWIQADEPNQQFLEHVDNRIVDNRLKRLKAVERDYRKSAKLHQDRLNDTYIWVDVQTETETVRTTTITPV